VLLRKAASPFLLFMGDQILTAASASLNVELYDWFKRLRPNLRTGILSNSFVGAREREQELPW
jgi:hypothetical protein